MAPTMTAAAYGYALSSEEHRPSDLVRWAQRAEELGFSFVSVSDHYHPWIDKQGQSPFVWCVLGGVAATTGGGLSVGTGVTCPTVRIHPAVIAQAAATAADMMPGRFFFGVGSGENLNEHVIGARWPSADERLEMLEEAVEVIRKLWDGGYVNHHGRHYEVENARIYTLPDELPPIIVSAFGTKAAGVAGRIGDGLWTKPDREVLEAYQKAGGSGPVYGQVTVCWAEDEKSARRTAHEWWPNTAIPGQLSQELALPAHFEQAAELVREEDVASPLTVGPDPEPYVEQVREMEAMGFTHVYLHQVGPDQDGFFRFWERELRPRLG